MRSIGARATVFLLAVIAGPATLANAQDADSAAVDSLVRALRSPSRDLRIGGAIEIQMRRVTAPRAVDALREMVVHEKDSFARSKAIWALAAIGPAACSALPTILPLVRSRNPDTRADALAALGGIGPDCGDAAQDSAMIMAAATALKDPVSTVRYYALQAADDLHQTQLVVDALRSPDDTVAENAAHLLALYEPSDTVVNGLLAALSDRRRAVRQEAVYSLGGLGPSVRDALVKATANPQSIRARGAREAIRYLDYASAAPVADRCYRLDMTRWTPDLGLEGDTVFSTPPSAVRFTTAKMDMMSDSLTWFRVEPFGVPYSVHGPAAWHYSGDSLSIIWTTGFSGLEMQLRVAGDTLLGQASTFWDFPRTAQSSEVRGIPIACGAAPRHPARFHR